MNMYYKILSIGILATLFFGCGSSGEKTQEAAQEKKVEFAAEKCTYNYVDGAEVKWTAFKFTEKKGVGGGFDSVEVKSQGAVENQFEILKDLAFDIYTSSVNSKDAGRDKKISELFFGVMNDGARISGQVKEVNGDAVSGEILVSLTMNGHSKDQSMAYSINGQNVSLTGEIDLLNWEGQDAVNSLNEACKALHTGEDGVSKLWTVVDVEVNAVLNKECK